VSRPELNVTNHFVVVWEGDGRVAIWNPPRGPMSPDDALLLAAWLVAVSSRPRERFLEILDAVEGT
jgi:hypothetical protein